MKKINETKLGRYKHVKLFNIIIINYCLNYASCKSNNKNKNNNNNFLYNNLY